MNLALSGQASRAETGLKCELEKFEWTLLLAKLVAYSKIIGVRNGRGLLAPRVVRDRLAMAPTSLSPLHTNRPKADSGDSVLQLAT